MKPIACLVNQMIYVPQWKNKTDIVEDVGEAYEFFNWLRYY
jgi:hypothetical protein